MDSVLSIRDIRKTFGTVKAVDGVSFEVRRGHITGLLGRNGAGKTTTIRMVTGIFMPDSGEIEWHGGGDSRGFQDRIGYLPEERGLYRQMKVLEQLYFFAEIKSRARVDVAAKAESWLKRFELWDKKDTKIEELSKGNQQKVQLIGTLLHDPELVILDEPMSGLDPVNVVLVRNLLKEIRDSGRTILLSTHMMGEAEKLVDDIVLIHDGEVVLQGDLDELRETNGTNVLELAFDGDGSFLSGLAGVARASVHASAAELTLEPGADTQAILREVFDKVRLTKFDIALPSLEEIFIERVGEDTLTESAGGES